MGRPGTRPDGRWGNPGLGGGGAGWIYTRGFPQTLITGTSGGAAGKETVQTNSSRDARGGADGVGVILP